MKGSFSSCSRNRKQVSSAPEAAADAGAVGASALSNAMFSSLLQGVMQEVAGVVSGQQSPNTVAFFLRNFPDFSYVPGESFLFDLFMTMVRFFISVFFKSVVEFPLFYRPNT